MTFGEINERVAENVMGQITHKPGELVLFGAGKREGNSIRLDSCADQYGHKPIARNYSTDASEAMSMEQKIFDDGRAVGYINELRAIVLADANTTASDDWYHWFLVAHATPLQRCRAALNAYEESASP